MSQGLDVLSVNKELFFPNPSSSGKKWEYEPIDSRAQLAISQTYQVSSLLSEVILKRDISFQEVPAFLNPTLKELLPDPSQLLDFDEGVEIILLAIQREDRITLFADYDVDGATSSSIIRRYLYDIGVEADVYIPDRITEGYGPNIKAFQKIANQGTRAIIVLDCGTTSFEPFIEAKRIGLQSIIIDHHNAKVALPEANAIINPNRLDEANSLGDLCTAGLAFLFIVGLNRALRKSGYFENRIEPDLRYYLDLVALGTVCDVMPLKMLNRCFVRQGLKVMQHEQNLGIKALLQKGRINGKLSAYHLGFVLGPRINAGGRVGLSQLGSELLSSRDLTLSLDISSKLEHYNQQRQTLEHIVLEQAIQKVEDLKLHQRSVIMVGGDDWHPGVVGIVAGRLKERYQKAACVVSFDAGIGKGSGRSLPMLPLGQAMHQACQLGFLLQGGGHAMAAGFCVAKESYDSFYDFLDEAFRPFMQNYIPSIRVDGLLQLSAINHGLIEELSALEPFGQGNPTPKFAFLNVTLKGGIWLKESHFKCDLIDTFGTRVKGIAFRAYQSMLGDALQKHINSPVHVIGTIKSDMWNGKEQITILIEDLMEV